MAAAPGSGTAPAPGAASAAPASTWTTRTTVGLKSGGS